MFVLAFSLPLALYLLGLGAVNSRRRPVLVPGPWDFAGVLFAGSGFLLYGGPLALSMFSDRVRLALVLRRGPLGDLSPDLAWYGWLALSVLYFAAVVGGAALVLRRRARSAAVYNVAPDAVGPLLEGAFARAGVDATPAGHTYFLKPAAWRAASLPDDLATGTARLEVDVFRWMNHATLRWDVARSALRDEVERELGKGLEATEAPPSLLWFGFSALAFLAFAVGFFGTVAVEVYRVFRP